MMSQGMSTRLMRKQRRDAVAAQRIRGIKGSIQGKGMDAFTFGRKRVVKDGVSILGQTHAVSSCICTDRGVIPDPCMYQA